MVIATTASYTDITGGDTDGMTSVTPDLLRDITINVSIGNSQRCAGNGHLSYEQSSKLLYPLPPPPCERSQDASPNNVPLEPQLVDKKRQRSKRRRVKTFLTRVFCALGWVLFCPCWSFGVCIREKPETLEDLREDPCWPCFYRGSSFDSDSRLDTSR